MKNIFYTILCLITLSGCSGCSKSGRKNQMQSSGNKVQRPIRNNIPSIRKDPEISSLSNQPQVNGLFGNLAEMYQRLKPTVFLVEVSYSTGGGAQGSGFFITSSGLGVSNYHVFKGGTKGEAYIKMDNTSVLKVGNVLDYNEKLDYIIFEVISNNKIFPFVHISDFQPSVGDDVFAIGNPKGLEHTLSKGIVSSYRDNDLLMQTTAEITHGSSGGALFNMRGEAVGITTAGFGEANLNFAMNLQKLGIKRFTNR